MLIVADLFSSAPSLHSIRSREFLAENRESQFFAVLLCIVEPFDDENLFKMNFAHTLYLLI